MSRCYSTGRLISKPKDHVPTPASSRVINSPQLPTTASRGHVGNDDAKHDAKHDTAHHKSNEPVHQTAVENDILPQPPEPHGRVAEAGARVATAAAATTGAAAGRGVRVRVDVVLRDGAQRRRVWVCHRGRRRGQSGCVAGPTMVILLLHLCGCRRGVVGGVTVQGWCGCC